jgi:sirohydrochlorin ferrochelatase
MSFVATPPEPAGLLLVAHGSRVGVDPAIGTLAQSLRSDFGEVAVCVLRGEPTPAEALNTMAARRVHVVPLLMASGHVGGHILASLLPATGRSRLCLHPPIGDHPGLAALVCDSVCRAVTDHGVDLERAAVILVGHGNERDPASAAAVHRLADSLRTGGCAAAEIHVAFLSQPPRVKHWRDLTARRDVVLVPCFLSGGSHTQIDLPALLAGDGSDPFFGAAARRLWVTPPLAAQWHGLAALILDSVFGTVNRGRRPATAAETARRQRSLPPLGPRSCRK